MKYSLLTCLMVLGSFCYAQEEDVDYAAELAKLELELDSMSIFNLIDSVLNLPTKPPSEFNFRLGYTSNVLSAGRNYGIEQHGISPGISFYHKSGFFGDLTGFWNSESDPKYNMSMVTLGYLGMVGNKWFYTGSYERWFYHQPSSGENLNPELTNSIGGSLSYNEKFGIIGVDYSFLFGQETAHRIFTNLAGRLVFRDFWVFDRVTIYPGVSLLWGNENITIQYPQNALENIRISEFISTFRGDLSAEEHRLVRNYYDLFRAGRITRRQMNLAIADLFLSSPTVLEAYNASLYGESNVFGLMNYSLTLPISFYFNRSSVRLSYSYSIPVKLPGETFDLEPIGYFGLTYTYRLPLR